MNLVRCGVKSWPAPAIGEEINHPIYGLIRIIKVLAFVCGEFLVEAERLHPDKLTVIDEIR